MTHHSGVMGPNGGLLDYTMEVVATGQKPLTRVIDEGIRVKDLENDTKIDCLNSKSEYYQAEFIRVSYTRGAGQTWTGAGPGTLPLNTAQSPNHSNPSNSGQQHH